MLAFLIELNPSQSVGHIRLLSSLSAPAGVERVGERGREQGLRMTATYSRKAVKETAMD